MAAVHDDMPTSVDVVAVPKIAETFWHNFGIFLDNETLKRFEDAFLFYDRTMNDPDHRVPMWLVDCIAWMDSLYGGFQK